MPAFIRVRDKSTNHEFDVAESAFDADTMTRVNASKQYPDVSGDNAYPRETKVRTDKAGQPAQTEES